jgi:hypothetical protein
MADGALGVADEEGAPSPRESGDPGNVTAAFQRAQELAEGEVALAPDDEIDAGILGLVDVRRETRVVAADEDARLRPERAHELDHFERGLALERHDRQADHVRRQLGDEPCDGLRHRALHEHEIGHRHLVMRIRVPRERRQRAIRHPHRHGRRVLERIRHREEQDVHEVSRLGKSRIPVGDPRFKVTSRR